MVRARLCEAVIKEFLSSFDTVLCLSNTSYKPFLFWTFLYHILGDLKLVEKPQPIMLGPNDFSNIKVRIAATFRSNRIEWTLWLACRTSNENIRVRAHCLPSSTPAGCQRVVRLTWQISSGYAGSVLISRRSRFVFAPRRRAAVILKKKLFEIINYIFCQLSGECESFVDRERNYFWKHWWVSVYKEGHLVRYCLMRPSWFCFPTLWSPVSFSMDRNLQWTR